jgi:putative transposase
MVKEFHHRRSIRLKGYDYAQPGGYFVTIGTHNQLPLFGEVTGHELVLNTYGEIVQQCWKNLTDHYQNIILDSFIVMPDHVHGIIMINEGVRAGLKPAPIKKHPLSEIVRAFKTFSSRKINEKRASPGLPVWQRNYYERIIRNEKELDSIREYIIHNVLKWELKRDNRTFAENKERRV